jgi:hypothetical protein
MERYHTDLNFQALIDRARAERAATLAAYAYACGRLLVSLASGMLARVVRLAPGRRPLEGTEPRRKPLAAPPESSVRASALSLPCS